MILTRRRLFHLAAAAPLAAAGAAVARPTVASSSAPVARRTGRMYTVAFLRRHLQSFDAHLPCSSYPSSWKFAQDYNSVWIPESDAWSILWVVMRLHNGRLYSLQMSRLPTPGELEVFYGYAGYPSRPFGFPNCIWNAVGNGETLHS